MVTKPSDVTTPSPHASGGEGWGEGGGTTACNFLTGHGWIFWTLVILKGSKVLGQLPLLPFLNFFIKDDRRPWQPAPGNPCLSVRTVGTRRPNGWAAAPIAAPGVPWPKRVTPSAPVSEVNSRPGARPPAVDRAESAPRGPPGERPDGVRPHPGRQRGPRVRGPPGGRPRHRQIHLDAPGAGSALPAGR